MHGERSVLDLDPIPPQAQIVVSNHEVLVDRATALRSYIRVTRTSNDPIRCDRSVRQ